MTQRWWVAVVGAALVAASGCGKDPLLVSVTPDVARSDEEIVLSGSGFGTQRGQVLFDNRLGTVLEWTPERIKVRVPMHTVPDVTLKVKPKEGGGASLPFVIYDAMTAVDGRPGKARTFITISFDDTTADQLQARNALEEHGMRATFYVNSSRIGSVASDLPAYMTLEELTALQAAGHEIGGHSKHHLNLSLLERDEVSRQVCGDRERLLSLGLQADNFAYPFSSFTPDVAQVVESCGYSSARAIDRSGTWPPVVGTAARYQVPAWISVHGGIALSRLEQYVTEAEVSESTWAVLVFHRLCESGCGNTAVKPSNFDAFVEWLSRRQPRGTVVRTMRQMMGKGHEMKGSVPPPLPRPGPNLIINPSLERYSSGTINPDCFILADTGHQLEHWQLVSPGHEGQYAVSLSAGDPVSVNRRMKMLQDDGECAPIVDEAGEYEFSVWYQSDVPLRFNAFLKNGQAFWAPWALSPVIEASPGEWKQATWRLPAIPPGMKSMSVSVRLQQEDGNMMLDDFSLIRLR
jgi:peptidoglycan/xylan/chitin deacetylase (PgdA/CDA1 family)